MTAYIHELSQWPHFRWAQEALAKQLAGVRHRQGRLVGRMQGLGFPFREEAVLKTLTEDVLKTSEIEGEILSRDQIRSSIARRLGMDVGALPPADRHVEGIVEMMLDATQKYKEPLTVERLFGWHAALFPSGRSGMSRIIVGAWRDEKSGPMQVISGPFGKETVHYEAPVAGRLDAEMKSFLDWLIVKRTLTPSSRPASRIFGSSRSILSTTAMVALPERSRIWRWPDQKTALNDFTACPHKSGWNGKPTTISLNRPRRVASTSLNGWNGFWHVWNEPLTVPRKSSRPS